MKRLLVITMLLALTTTSYAHRVKYMGELYKIKLGMSREEVRKIMNIPDDAIGTMRGLEIWKYDINRYRTSLEKSDVFLVGLLLPVLGWVVCTFLPEQNTYCFWFATDGTLLQWGQSDDWDAIKSVRRIE